VQHKDPWERHCCGGWPRAKCFFYLTWKKRVVIVHPMIECLMLLRRHGNVQLLHVDQGMLVLHTVFVHSNLVA
jgi:hypothetical protein